MQYFDIPIRIDVQNNRGQFIQDLPAVFTKAHPIECICNKG